MDYTREFRKFISSQYLYNGIRVTAGVIIPALVLNYFGLLASMVAVPLGALVVAFTDVAGPPQHRRNGMLVSIALNFVVIVIVGLSRHWPWLVGLEIILFGFFFSLIGVYGNRINVIGQMALLVFIFNIDSSLPSLHIWKQAAWFTVGGLWYALLSLALYTLRPYKLIQQSLGESLMEIADYLRIKAAFYGKERDTEQLYKDMISHQVIIHQHQGDLHDMLFRARSVAESTSKSRILMVMFLDSMDLFERIMTTQQDYEHLHKESGDTGILPIYQHMIIQCADALQRIGLATQEGLPYKDDNELDHTLKETSDAYFALRDQQLGPHSIESFIRLRHILYSIEDLVERISILARYTTYDSNLSKNKELTEKLSKDQFTSHEELNSRLFLDNLSLKSSHFRHAVRITLAMVIGYTISLLYPLGHGYWILLTIITIMKPAYSITKQRNWHRIGGTLIGAALSFGVLYITQNNTILFIVMLLSMILAYTYLKLNYLVGSAGITVYVVMSFHFLNPGGLTSVLQDRVIDTAIGSLIAWIISTFVLPLWEHEQIDPFILRSIKANRAYFNQVALPFTGQPLDISQFRATRKESFVELANMSDHFQRMLSEPRNKQPGLPQYHQFVATSHLLTSHIASLSYYAQRSAKQYASQDFVSLLKQIDQQFERALHLLEKHTHLTIEQKTGDHPIRAKLQQLFEQRRQEMKAGPLLPGQSVRRTLSELKAITDQFQLIYSITAEQVKILDKMEGNIK